MSRAHRRLIIVPGLPHHVVLRANNRRNLFSRPHDRLRFLRFVAEAGGPEPCSVFGLALMTNHVHMIVLAVSFEGTWKWIKEIAQRYATYRNREQGSTGKVFEQRYGIAAIRSERRLAATTAYVDLNPVRAGIASPWTTRSLHAGRGPVIPAIREIWTPSPWWLALGADDEARRAQYREFCELRQESWAADVVSPLAPRPSPPSHANRANRPDRSKVA